jgi:phosphoenolpyruvate synthase/pyruvate phosphate dikinase
VDTRQPFIVSLADAYDYSTEVLGNKARNLSLCIKKGFKVPAGFCISSSSYLAFTELNSLQPGIDLELYRKDFSAMRWEEIWDAALRIRSLFLKGSMPTELEQQVKASVPGGLKAPSLPFAHPPGQKIRQRHLLPVFMNLTLI